MKIIVILAAYKANKALILYFFPIYSENMPYYLWLCNAEGRQNTAEWVIIKVVHHWKATCDSEKSFDELND